MTITIVCDILGEENNGTTIACMNLIRFLRAQGHTVRVVCADQDKAGNECFYVVPELNLYLLNPIVERNGVTLPRKLATEATADNLNAFRLKEKAKAAQIAREKAEAEENAKKLGAIQVKIAAKAGSNGKLFGSVTSKEISDALHEQFDLTIEKQKIVQAEPIKSFGAYEVKCKLGYEVTGTIHVLVIEEK